MLARIEVHFAQAQQLESYCRALFKASNANPGLDNTDPGRQALPWRLSRLNAQNKKLRADCFIIRRMPARTAAPLTPFSPISIVNSMQTIEGIQ